MQCLSRVRKSIGGSSWPHRSLSSFSPIIEKRKAPGFYTWLSLPYGCYGGPIFEASPEQPPELGWNLVWEFLTEQKFSAINLTLPPGIEHSSWKDYRVRPKTTQVLDLQPDFESLVQEKFTPACRRAIRKAERGKIEIKILESESDLNLFDDLYHRSMERWGETEGYPLELFKQLWLLPDVNFWGAFDQGEPISVALILTHGSHQYYWLGAMDERAQHLRPNNLLFYRILEQSCRSGIRTFDFGNSSGLIGVFNFKKGFGPQVLSYSQLYYAGSLVSGYRKIRALLKGQPGEQ